MKSTDLRTVPFHGDEIVTFEREGGRYVAMRRIVENIGLDWSTQHRKLLDQKDKFNCGDMTTVGADGKSREMFAMPVEKLPLWLASINPAKLRNLDVRAKVERYQAESAIALHDYWTKGAAFNERAFPPDIREMLDRMFGIERMLSRKVTDQGRIIEAQAHEISELRGMIEVNPNRSMPEFPVLCSKHT